MGASAPKVLGPHDGHAGFLGSIGVRFMIEGHEAGDRCFPCENVIRDGQKQSKVRFQRQTECGITNAQDFRRLGSTLKWQEDRDGSARETFSEPCERGPP